MRPFSGLAPSKLKFFFQLVLMVAYLHIEFCTYQFLEESKGGGVESTGSEKSVVLRGLNDINRSSNNIALHVHNNFWVTMLIQVPWLGPWRIIVIVKVGIRFSFISFVEHSLLYVSTGSIIHILSLSLSFSPNLSLSLYLSLSISLSLYLSL